MAFKVASVEVSDRGSEATLVAEDGRSMTLRLRGGCCSSSFFDDGSSADLKSLRGRTLTKLEEVSCAGAYTPTMPNAADGDTSTENYCLVVTHDGGQESIFWRNESNGHYSGTLDASMGPFYTLKDINANL